MADHRVRVTPTELRGENQQLQPHEDVCGLTEWILASQRQSLCKKPEAPILAGNHSSYGLHRFKLGFVCMY